MEICHKCKEALIPNAKFCDICGEKVPKMVQEARVSTEKENICTHCLGEMRKDAKFCDLCGGKVPEPKVEIPSQCQECNEELRVGAKFCDHCGAKTGETSQEIAEKSSSPPETNLVPEPTQISPKEEKPKVQQSFCQDCGEGIEKGQLYCHKCEHSRKIDEIFSPNSTAPIFQDSPQPMPSNTNQSKLFTNLLLVVGMLAIVLCTLAFEMGKSNSMEEENNEKTSETKTESSTSNASTSSSSSSNTNQSSASSSTSSSTETSTAPVEKTSNIAQLVGNTYYYVYYPDGIGVQIEILALNGQYFAYMYAPYSLTKNGDSLLSLTENGDSFTVAFDGGSLNFTVNALGELFVSGSLDGKNISNKELEQADTWLDGRYARYDQGASTETPLQVELWYRYLTKRWFASYGSDIRFYDTNKIQIISCSVEDYRGYWVDYTFYESDMSKHTANGDLMGLELGFGTLTIDGAEYYS